MEEIVLLVTISFLSLFFFFFFCIWKAGEGGNDLIVQLGSVLEWLGSVLEWLG